MRSDLDETRVAPDSAETPPFVDERFYLDEIEQVGFVVFEIRVALETTTGETVEGGTVAVAHPRLAPHLVTEGSISNACGWRDPAVSIDGDDEFSRKLLDNRSQIAQFCDSPEVRGRIGANENLDSLLRDVIGCA